MTPNLGLRLGWGTGGEDADRIFVFDSDAARIFGRIVANRRRVGRPISRADAQIMAITQVRRAKLATRNVDDFLDCGLDILNPWAS